MNKDPQAGGMLISHEKKLGICYYTKKEKKRKGALQTGSFWLWSGPGLSFSSPPLSCSGAAVAG